jgi:phosphoserine phosphatase RsbU/P
VRLLLYTDGVTETAAPDGDLFGVDRLAAVAAAACDRRSDAFADALIVELQRFRGMETAALDDVTFVVVDFTEPTGQQ